ncbi:protein kinase activating protein dpb11 [Sporothrix stenoceras]|uniref:Protein kinase activating protein dpb11 n=1 Tax=Sporothrix stenoceras TaxID=5173 RepID=A0ABR3YRF2_9PEZI
MESAPFAGVVLCCTSIPVDLRTDLANKVTELGGVHKNDLTHEVTHLIVGDYNTPKYRHVARDRPDIKAMCAGWVDAVRDPWTRDAPIDFPALEAAWRLKTFEVHGGLPGIDDEPEDDNGEQNGDGGAPGEGGSLSKRGRLLCSVTGFEEEDRQAVIALIVNNGGVYSGDLTRAVTHLIVNKPEGKKYNAALHWNIRTVAIEWLHDSVSRGMILDETKYDPRLPPHERGKDAWVRNHAERTASILGKRLRDAAAAAAAEKQNGQRKLRKTTSQKLSVQRDDLWGDILGKPAQPSPAPEPVAPEAAMAVSSKRNTPAPESSRPTNGAEAQKPAQRASAQPTDVSDGGVLSTSIFCIHGFSQERTNVLAGAVATMGGSVATSLEEMAAIATRRPEAPLYQHVIVPQEERPELHPAVADNVLLITEFFIERCLHKKQYALSGGPSTTLAQQPNPGTIGRPFPVFPIPGFDTLSVCSSGFTGVDLNQIDKTVRQLGAKYEERFTAQCSVLVVTSLPAVRKQKLELALSWKVPVVDAKWLSACIASGTLVSVGDYLFPQLRQNPSSLNGPAVRPLTAAKLSNDLEPTVALTVPTLVVASPRTLHAAAQQDEDGKLKNKNGNETDLDLTAPYETAPSHQDEPALPRIGRNAAPANSTTTKAIEPATSSAAPSAVQRPLVNNPFRDDSESPPSQRPSVVAVPPEPVPLPPQLQQQQQQPKPRQPFDRVLSEIADSAAGDSSDGLLDSDDGGVGGSNKVSPLKQLRHQKLQQQQQTKSSKSTSTTMKRSSTTTAPTTTTAATTIKPIQRPMLSRVLSDGLSHHHKPAIPIGISIGDLMKDTGAPAKSSIPALQQQQPIQQHLQSAQQPHLQKSSPFGRSHSSVSGMSVPETDGPPQRGGGLDITSSATADTSDMPPTQIQVQYLDPEAERMREQLMRKIMGGAEPAEAQRTSSSSAALGLGEENAALRAGTAEEALAEVRHNVRRSSRLR